MNQGAGPPSLSLSGREPATGRGGAASCVCGGRPLARRPESRRAGMSAPHIVASGPSVRPAPTHRNAASGLHDTVPPLIGRPPRSPLPSLYSLCQLFLSTQLPNCQLIPLRYKARGQDEPSAVPSPRGLPDPQEPPPPPHPTSNRCSSPLRVPTLAGSSWESQSSPLGSPGVRPRGCSIRPDAGVRSVQ